MIQVNRIRIVANTIGGLYGADVSFKKGLNIVRGDNTSGKSTLLQCLLYCLGLEQLLGGRDEKTMQSVLKDEIELGAEKIAVLQSEVLMEIENSRGEIVTVNRSIRHSARDSRLVDVYSGGLSPEGLVTGQLRSMYVHDSGAAQDEVYGFHAFLETFIGIQLPTVRYVDGSERKLYIQTVAPASLIEQKRGWSDFLATIPYFQLRSPEKRAVEFVLAMDVLETAKRKQEVTAAKQDIQNKWSIQYAELTAVASKGGVTVANLPQQPSVLNSLDAIFFRVSKEDDTSYSLAEHIEALQYQLEQAEVAVARVGERTEEYQQMLSLREDRIRELARLHDTTSDSQALEMQRFKDFQRQLTTINEDIRKNKGYQKIKKLGSEMGLALANEQCPTCHQAVHDTLLPQDIDQEPLGVEENILHLDAQRKMYELYLKNQRSVIQRNAKTIEQATERLSDMRAEVRRLKSALVQDERLPSEYDIEERIRVKSRLKFFDDLLGSLKDHLTRFKGLSEEWLRLLDRESRLPADYFSIRDHEKLVALDSDFKRFLGRFGYSSKSEEYINVTADKYQPTVNGLNMKLGSDRYDLRYDSSASDFVRAIWAYTCALCSVSQRFNGNHMGLIVLDEPAQHSMANKSLHSLLEVLSEFDQAQCIVAASFNDTDRDFEESTSGVQFNYFQIGNKLVERLTIAS